MARDKILAQIADAIIGIKKPTPRLIAIDGVDGAGKTIFAAALKQQMESAGHEVILLSVDHFHNPKDIRYAKGPDSPLGFYYDSYNYSDLIRWVLEPFSQGQGFYHSTAFDCDNDRHNLSEPLPVNSNSILLMEGIFLQRPELIGFWDLKIFLDVDFKTNLQRNIDRANASDDSETLERLLVRFNTRYKPGQELYFREASPKESADIVIDNNNYAAPFITHNSLTKRF